MESKKAHGHKLAQPGKRILATLLDVIVAGLITATISLPFGIASAFSTLAAIDADNLSDIANSLAASQGTSFIGGILGLAVWALVFLIVPIYVWNGQTLGKKALNLKIAREDGKQITAMDIVKRYSIYIVLNSLGLISLIYFLVSCVGFILPVVNLTMLFTDAKRQTLLDKIGQTVVVDA